MRAKTELDAGRQLLGRFWLASTGDDPAHRAAGVPNSMDTEWAFAPEWSIRTGTDVIVKPKRSAKLDVLYRTGAAPLLSLVVVAGDQPDSIISEVVAMRSCAGTCECCAAERW